MQAVGLGHGEVGKVDTIEAKVRQTLLHFLALTGFEKLAGVASVRVRTCSAWLHGAPH